VGEKPSDLPDAILAAMSEAIRASFGCSLKIFALAPLRFLLYCDMAGWLTPIFFAASACEKP
jgi:hypothetical protein